MFLHNLKCCLHLQDLTLRKILSDNGLKDKTKGGTVEVRQAANADI
ncbi:hypothetical protein [Clostridium estertheticum]|nr:hypothetical protein [Clostridium estertheticum]